MRRLAVILLGMAAGAFAAPPTFRLPDTVRPRLYALELSIDPDAAEYDGRANITVELAERTEEIWLNGKDLAIAAAEVDGRAVGVASSGGEFLKLTPPRPVGPGTAVLSIRFRARLEEKLPVGAFRRKVGRDWYVFTTFTPIEARRAFPCFDEPRFKAPWEVTLRVPPGSSGFSNSREASVVEESGGWRRIRFEATQPLPSELVAFAAGPFEVVDGGIAGASTPVRVIVPKGHAAEGAAAIRSTALVLPRLEAYTGIPYPFGKLDHIAVPDLEFNAVENPGLIVYRSRLLLLDPDADLQQAGALRNLEAHEIAHQWFGNLVTQADWNDVWLSEGFATWLGAKVMDQEQAPERVHLSAIATRERIMRADSARGRAVRTGVGAREASAEIYNRFVYDKGAAVLMMLERWIGEEQFQAGLRQYLRRHQFGVATVDELAGALEAAAGREIGPVLHGLLDLGGAPLVQGELKCDLAKPELVITRSGPAAPFPVCWRTEQDGRCELLTGENTPVAMNSCPAWFYLNSDGTGYYRTRWEANQLAGLRLHQLSPAERLTLAFDLRAQGTGGEAARAMLENLTKDAEPEIAAAAREALKQ